MPINLRLLGHLVTKLLYLLSRIARPYQPTVEMEMMCLLPRRCRLIFGETFVRLVRIKLVVVLIAHRRSLELRRVPDMAQLVVEPGVCQQVGPAFGSFAALRLEGHLLQQVLHVLVLEEVGRR